MMTELISDTLEPVTDTALATTDTALATTRECNMREVPIAEQIQNIRKGNERHIIEVFKSFDPTMSDTECLSCYYNSGRKYKLRHRQISLFSDTDRTHAISYIPTQLNDIEVVKRLQRVGFAELYLSATWQEADKNHLPLQKAIIKRFIIEGDDTRGYCIFGNIGIGKSSLMALFAQLLMKYLQIDGNILATKAQRMVNAVSSINDEDKELAKRLPTVPILFVDAFGFENYSTDAQIAKLTDIFEDRYSNKLTTFIASNADLRELWDRNSFYQQLASYLLDEKNFVNVVELQGSFRR